MQTAVNYPVTLPFLPAYKCFGHVPADFPVAHGNQSRILSLPIFPEMSPSHVDSLEQALLEFGA